MKIEEQRVVKAAIAWEKADTAFKKNTNKKNTWRSILAEADLREAVRALKTKEAT